VVQFVWVPAERVEKVMVLLPDVAVVVDEVQSPPYVREPPSVVEKV
jgi:hypothetical protein